MVRKMMPLALPVYSSCERIRTCENVKMTHYHVGNFRQACCLRRRSANEELRKNLQVQPCQSPCSLCAPTSSSPSGHRPVGQWVGDLPWRGREDWQGREGRRDGGRREGERDPASEER
jgi:hypothetical protein